MKTVLELELELSIVRRELEQIKLNILKEQLRELFVDLHLTTINNEVK